MVSARSLARSPAQCALLAALLLLPLVAPALLPAPAALSRVRRQLADEDALQPLEDASEGAEQAREKRKLEGVTEAKFGIKNAVLGFVFGKINSLIDAKTRFVDTLDKKNIEINKQYGIEAPSQGGLASLTGVIGQVIGPKLQLLGPKIQAVTGLLGGASGGGGSSVSRRSEALRGKARRGTSVTRAGVLSSAALALRGRPARRRRRARTARRSRRGAGARARVRAGARGRRTTSLPSTATRSAWTSRGTCLGRPSPFSFVPLRSSATSSRTRRCATRVSCGCSGRCSAVSSRSRAWTRPPPPPPAPPPLPRAPPRRPAPPPPRRTTRCAAGGICRSRPNYSIC